MAKKKTGDEDQTTEGAAETAGVGDAAQAGTNQPATDPAGEAVNDDGGGDAAPRSTKLVPMDNGATEASEEAKALLIDACNRFGVDPTEQADRRELASWKFYRANRRDRVPASVV